MKFLLGGGKPEILAEPQNAQFGYVGGREGSLIFVKSLNPQKLIITFGKFNENQLFSPARGLPL